MKAGVSAVIMSVVYDMASGIVTSKDFINIGIMLLAFVANYYLHINIIFIILVTAAFGVILTLIRERLGGEAK